MKKDSFLIICTLLTGLLFTTCEPWIVPEAVFVNFNANGGQGDMKALRFMDGEEQALTKNTYTRNGYIFDGWNTRSDGRGQRYADRQNVSITKSVTLYAQWKHSRGKENGHEWVDLGLPSGIKWATCNVGATTPEGYGDYFAWGEIAPKYDYSWETYKFRTSGDSRDNVKFNKYNTSSDYGTIDNKTTLDLSDDAARVNWGGKWRMPTKAEQDELRNNCTWTWATQSGVNGYKVTSKTNGNSIFLPAAGYRYGTSFITVGSYGNYWLSSLYESNPSEACCLSFYSGVVGWSYIYRYFGRTVRAVFSENDTPSTFVTLSFDANGGSGTMAAQTFEAGVSQAIAANAFTRSGYTFTGWNTNADGSGTSYTDGQEITLTQDITLYAQWESAGGSGGGSSISGSENGYDYVDLGLPSGLKWATCNVGATAPEGYGDYFAWGETSPKSNYTSETYKYCNGSFDNVTKYCTDSYYGTVDNKTTLELSDDAARVNWGGTWRMPTEAEQDELRNNCTWTWITQNGVDGYKVTSKTNGNSIFLPAAGYRSGTSVYDVGSDGDYWSSSLYESHPGFAFYLCFDSGKVDWFFNLRHEGRPVRAVCGNNTAAQTFTLTFNANGGTGTMAAQTFEAGVSQAIAANAFTRSGYTFTGWNTKADGSGNSYTDGQEIALSQDITLYAQWDQEQVVSGTENGHDYVDLGLPSGLKWATCNVGATTPEGYGDYFAWGETSPKDNYDWSTYKYCNGSQITLTKYNADSSRGSVDNKTTLDLSDDAARANWGDNWRMPTYAEIKELINNCKWTWTNQNGVNGYKVTSKTNGNSIFLPAAGDRRGTSVSGVGSYGHYWSSSLYESDPSRPYFLGFKSGNVDWYYNFRDYGLTIRAVCGNNTAAQTFTLTFNANGGTGTMAAQTFEAGVWQAIATNAFTRSGYTFTRWNTNADGSGTIYADKQSITISQNITLYAQWESAGGSGGGNSTSGIENGHEWVDLGLPSGLKWATCNVGATAPEGYGDYFAWGETNPKDNYNWSTYKYCNGSETSLTKYNTKSDYGTVDNKTTLDLSDDAARANWGGTWRMPSRAELDELLDNCTWTRTTQSGVNGYKVTSNTNGNSIFLPAAGYRNGTSVNYVGSRGLYWSSSLYESDPSYAYNLYFYSGNLDWGRNYRYGGRTVRAVCP